MNDKENPIVIIPTIQPMMEETLVQPMMVEQDNIELVRKPCGNCDKCKCPK